MPKIGSKPETTVRNYMRKPKRKVFALFIDFARAFPSVPHNKLWQRLWNLGVSTKILDLLQNLYQESKTIIRLHDGHSEPIELTEGLMQGDSLSPLLFSLYIWDIEKTLQEDGSNGIALNAWKQLHVLLFADDTVVIAPTLKALEKKITTLEKYLDELELKVNLEKTKIVIFGRGGRIPRGTEFKYKGKSIEIVPEYTYLGIEMSSSAVFNKQRIKAKLKATRVGATTLQLIFKTKLSNFHAHYTLFESIVKPTLLYGCAVWAHRYRQKLETIQNNYYRRLLGLHPRIQPAIVRLETGSKPIEVSIWEQTLNFLCKIKQMDGHRYAAIIFRRLLQLDQESPSWELNWVTQVRTGLQTFGLEALIEESYENILYGWNTSIKIIEDHFEEHDKYILQRLDSHPQYNSVFEYHREPATTDEENNQRGGEERSRTEIRWARLPWHLRSEEDLKMKRFITQLRQNSLYMKIKGEIVYVPNPAEEKICLYCNRNETDCLEHTLFVCPIVGISAQQLRQKGWKRDNLTKCLDQPWEDIKEIHGLIMNSLKYRRLMDIEVDQ